MALVKSIPLAANPEWAALYHRIEQAAYNRREKVLEVVVGLYPSAEHAAAELPPVETRVFQLKQEDAELPLVALHDAAGELLYSFLRSQELYADATNG
ncbi:MAG: hypothetical protein C0502_05065 [Opitutus sp.]|nr:hypothetical protein [Opitutus sp.]